MKIIILIFLAFANLALANVRFAQELLPVYFSNENIVADLTCDSKNEKNMKLRINKISKGFFWFTRKKPVKTFDIDCSGNTTVIIDTLKDLHAFDDGVYQLVVYKRRFFGMWKSVHAKSKRFHVLRKFAPRPLKTIETNISVVMYYELNPIRSLYDRGSLLAFLVRNNDQSNLFRKIRAVIKSANDLSTLETIENLDKRVKQRNLLAPNIYETDVPFYENSYVEIFIGNVLVYRTGRLQLYESYRESYESYRDRFANFFSNRLSESEEQVYSEFLRLTGITEQMDYRAAKKIYRSFMLKNHPDKVGRSAESENISRIATVGWDIYEKKHKPETKYHPKEVKPSSHKSEDNSQISNRLAIVTYTGNESKK